MLITPHAVTGAAIAALLPHPLLALPLSVCSHFVLDSIPHWQEILYPYKVTTKTWVRIPLDLTLAVGLVYVIIQAHPQHQALIIFSAIAANAPDFDTIFMLWKRPLRMKQLKRFYDWHTKIQWETPSHWGIVTQIVLCELLLAMSL